MARVIDYLAFAVNTGANVEGQSSYVIEPIRLTGHQAGVAKSAVQNKANRQFSVMVAALANVISEALDIDVLDDGDVDALKQKLQAVLLGGRTTIMNGDTNFYVSNSGSDGNDGLTPGSAWSTLQHAADTIFAKYNLNGFAAKTNIASGTYAPVFISGWYVGQKLPGSVGFYGAGPGTCIVHAVDNSAFISANGAAIHVEGVKVSAAGATTLPFMGNGLMSWDQGWIDCTNISFDTCVFSQNWVQLLSKIGFDDGAVMSVIGSASRFIRAYNNGAFSGPATVNATLTVGTGLAFTTFVESQRGSTVSTNTIALSGGSGCTGQRYNVDGTSTLDYPGSPNENYFPGDSAGHKDETYGYLNL